MGSNAGSHGPPPPPANPILSGYESFVRETPLVTRYCMTGIFTSYMSSFFVDPTMALANIPLFTVQKLELYRLVLSPIVCTDFLNLLFAYLSFLDNGKRLELSLGSAPFAWLLFTIGTITNLLFLLICETLYLITGNDTTLLQYSVGIWTILFGMIAMECAKAPPTMTRRLFFLQVPTLYYPLALLALFSLFGAFRISYFISILVGYAIAHGKLDTLKLNSSTFQTWEDGCLRNFTTRQGWVLTNAASGPNAWSLPTFSSSSSSQQQQHDAGGASGWSPQTFFGGSPSSSAADGTTGGGGTVASPPPGGWRAAGSSSSSGGTSFPASGGRTVGSSNNSETSQHPAPADARAARLAAVERRKLASNSEETKQ